MGLRAKEIVLSFGASQALKGLEESSDPTSVSTARRIRALKPIRLVDCLHGEVVRKDRIPKALRDRHGLENLYVEDLPSFWRLLYTIVRDRGERYIVVVEIVDHEIYDKMVSWTAALIAFGGVDRYLIRGPPRNRSPSHGSSAISLAQLGSFQRLGHRLPERDRLVESQQTRALLPSAFPVPTDA